MNDLLPVRVECYSGYKADEYPVRFSWNGVRIEIEETLDRWFQHDLNPEFREANYYKVRTTAQKIHILKYEVESGKWFLWIKGETVNL